MNRGARIDTVLLVLVALSLSSCGGGGGSPSASSPYTGITTSAVVTAGNADNIARGAFEGSDLGASTVGTLAPVRSGAGRPVEGRPMALILVRLLSEAAIAALPAPSSVRAPAPRATVTVDNTISDGMGGTAQFVLSVDDQTGAFTGTFTFTNFHGDAGGILNGTVAVSGSIGQNFLQFLFDFQSVRIVDGDDAVIAWGTVNLVADAAGASATLNLVFTDNVTRKTIWLSDYALTVTNGAGFDGVRMFGRIYLHDYGYVDVQTESDFIYPTGSTLPTGGAMTATGKDNRGVRLTVDSQTQYTLGVDSDGDGAYDDLTVTLSW